MQAIRRGIRPPAQRSFAHCWFAGSAFHATAQPISNKHCLPRRAGASSRASNFSTWTGCRLQSSGHPRNGSASALCGGVLPPPRCKRGCPRVPGHPTATRTTRLLTTTKSYLQQVGRLPNQRPRCWQLSGLGRSGFTARVTRRRPPPPRRSGGGQSRRPHRPGSSRSRCKTPRLSRRSPAD